jgi:dienelactone hydrolase
MLLLIGNYDSEVSYPDCASLADVQHPRGPEFRLKAYPFAGHSFDWDVGYTVFNRHSGLAEPNARAATDARREVTSFLRRYLKSN